MPNRREFAGKQFAFSTAGFGPGQRHLCIDEFISDSDSSSQLRFRRISSPDCDTTCHTGVLLCTVSYRIEGLILDPEAVVGAGCL